MAYANRCENCGAYLDPCETCDCQSYGKEQDCTSGTSKAILEKNFQNACRGSRLGQQKRDHNKSVVSKIAVGRSRQEKDLTAATDKPKVRGKRTNYFTTKSLAQILENVKG